MATAFFPLLAAVFFGLGYALMEKVVGTFSVATYMLVNGLVGVLIAFCLWGFRIEPVAFNFLSEKWTMIVFFLGAALAPGLGWLFTVYAVKDISAPYAAFGELSYPFFTMLFLFLFFGIRHFDWNILIGGCLIAAGSFILVYGQIGAKTG